MEALASLQIIVDFLNLQRGKERGREERAEIGLGRGGEGRKERGRGCESETERQRENREDRGAKLTKMPMLH